MSDQENSSSSNKSIAQRTVSDEEITTTRSNSRRLFLGTLGISALGATIIAVGKNHSSAQSADSDANDSKKHHDFPKKKNNDSDTTQNADMKNVDSDNRNSKAVDSDRSRLRDAKGSSDSD